ncbi:hypothetical protein [Cohaesibacter haloalkalitolerans]|uniref:hypothetical protein n=1 Tax=Cohaesibacter haloalkalitolerans TaxID=1162980 RepID=UPI0013C49309|nr:hypothetical protein [Cohaesibacter haloalkalitolerans]
MPISKKSADGLLSPGAAETVSALYGGKNSLCILMRVFLLLLPNGKKIEKTAF